MPRFYRHSLAFILLFVVIVPLVLRPLPAQAQLVTTSPDIIAAEGAKTIVGKIDEVLRNAALIGIRNTLSAFLGKLAYDAAVWVASTGTGQQGLVYDKPILDYVKDTGQAASGGLIDGLAQATGLDAANLCDPGANFRVNLTIGLDVQSPKGAYKPSCTLTELGGNWKDAYSDPNFNNYLKLQFDSTANPLGISLEASNLTVVAGAEAEKAAATERINSAFRDVSQKVSKTINTPGSTIQQELVAQGISTRSELYKTIGNPAVDAISVFTSTLASKLLERVQKGLANLSSGTVLPELISGESSGVSTGRSAAQETFAALKQPIFVSSGVFDILAELSSCPEDEDLVTVNNCAIGQNMQLAITDDWTVQEFIDQENMGDQYKFADDNLGSSAILSDGGITEKGIVLLKKYRIIPVGWQVAADYATANHEAVTLKQVADCYNACGSDDGVGSCQLLLTDADDAPTSYSPYCRLVDPNWVLKAPQNFCEREAPGPDLASLNDTDTDSNVNTQSTLIASRLNYCADSRGCIQEAQAGVCTAYGYCTAEDPIYRFDGDVCQVEYSSCQTFTDTDDNEVLYIKSSLNYDDCATDPGCQWYCASTNASGQFDCASPTSTYVSCSEDVATNETDYGLGADTVAYNSNQACICSTRQTCSVPPGSDSGDSNGDNLLDYRECTVDNSDGSTSVCTLSDNCGASNPTYNSATKECTCTVDNSCDVAAGDTSCPITVNTSSGGSGSHTCTLNDEDNDGSSDSCGSSYSTYTTAPVCEVSDVGIMNCGAACTTSAPGGTCVNNLGNNCTDGSATDGDGQTNSSCTLADQCSISSGDFKCTSATGNVCVLGTIAEDPTVQNDTLYFDNNLKNCDSSDAGCTQYIRMKSDTNLIPNAFFDYYDETRNTINDSNNDGSLDPVVDGDDVAFCSNNGAGCSSDSNCDLNSDGTPEGQCIGWIQNDVTAYVLNADYSSLVTPDLGTNYVEIPTDSAGTGSGTLAMTLDTGQNLANRTFTFSYHAMSVGSDCNDASFTIGTADGAQVSAPVTADTDGNQYTYTSDWQDYMITYTFPDEADANANYSASGAGTTITVAIHESTSCDIDIAGAELIESDNFDGNYINYAESNVTYLSAVTSCQPEDVGCELYVENGQSSDEGIPGIITNPDSDACVDENGNYDYSNPSCNQCDGDASQDQSADYYAGCSFYQEVPLDSTSPLTEVPSWLTPGTDAYNGVIQRLGGYCEADSSTHCYTDSDCGAGACIQTTSIVPSSGAQCAAAEVGCEEYTNLDSVAAGGEGLEYYTQLQQCVRTDDQDTAVYYTFAGSDTGGVQIEDHTLKVNSSTGAPCTHLDPQSEDYNADCVDDTYTSAEQSSWDCGPDGDLDADGSANSADPTTDADEYDTNADCRQYIDANGAIYYRLESAVIKASDDCTPLRNSLDTRVYFGIPAESNSCSEAAVGCREYKGTNSGSEETIIDENFDANSTDEWSGAESTSNESVLQSGYSLQLQDSDTSNTSNQVISHALFTQEDLDGDGTEDTAGLLNAGSSYILTFWAKVSDGGTLQASLDFDLNTTGGNYYFITSGASTTPAAITLDPNGAGGWQYYIAGPVIIPISENVDEGDEYFTLQFTGATAASTAYIDTIDLTESNSQYLIQDSARTCNGFEGCREYQDRDKNTYYLKSFERLCADSAVGCEAMIATQNSSKPFTEAYNLDNEYDQDDVIVPYDQPVTLVYDEDKQCSSAAMGCTELGNPAVDDQTGEITDFESMYELNQPDQYDTTLCEQPQLACREYTSTYDGTVYFKDPGNKTCELREYTSDGNTYNGWFKLDSSATTPDCPTQYNYSQYGITDASQPLGGVCNSNSTNEYDNRVGKLCNQDADCYPDGWQSGDPRPRCISTLDDDVDVQDGKTHQYVTTDDDEITLSDTVSDFGWVGVCPAEQSGCSEYIDPYSPNIEEINRNWSFEDDVRDYVNNSYYTSAESPDGFPDFWTITDDTSSSCSSSQVIMTTAETYIGATVAVANGAAAVSVGGNCGIENIGRYYPLAANKTYTIQAQVKMDKSQLLATDGSNADTAGKFSIGVHYYVADGSDSDDLPDPVTVSDEALYPVANQATVNFEEGSDDDGLSYWYRWQGSIGVGTTVPIPVVYQCDNAYFNEETSCESDGFTWSQQPVQYARVFLVNNSGESIYVDAVSFKQVDKYYYLDYTVDGTAEREQTDGTNTCLNQDTNQNEITSDGGCVAFRDVISDTQNYSQDGLTCTTCLLTPNSDACRYVVDACDTNTVLKVKKDRTCSEWLACETAKLVTNSKGNVSTQCFAINRCNQLDADGNCSRWVPKPDYASLNSSTDLHYTSAKSDADSLQAIRDLTGYSKVGVTWNDVLTCVGGPYDSQSCTTGNDCVNTSIVCTNGACSNTEAACSTAADCYGDNDAGTCTQPFNTEGYYPYGWMPEVGEYGAQTGEDLIELRDFEALYCSGTAVSGTVPCILNATSAGDPGQCYTNNLIQKVDADPADDITRYSDVVYVDDSGTGESFDPNNSALTDLAFCPNSPNFDSYWPFGGKSGLKYTTTGWSAIGSSAITVSQYQTYKDCVAPCADIDLNNVLQIGPQTTDQPFTGGAQYDLDDNIVQGGTYALSLDGRYVDTNYTSPDEGDTPSTISICLNHNNIQDTDGNTLERKDCFVNGFGEADIVFLVEDSNSMYDTGIIQPIGDGVTSLAEELSKQGIDAKFALATLDSNSSGSSSGTAFTDLRQDFTDSTTFTDADSALYHLTHDAKDNPDHTSTYYHNSDPYVGVIDVAHNSLNTQTVVAGVETQGDEAHLSFRSNASRFIILVTNRGDQLANISGHYDLDNGINETDAATAAQSAQMPTFVVTSNWSGGYGSQNDNDTCVYSSSIYDQLTASTNGAKYSFSVDANNQPITSCPDGAKDPSTDWTSTGITNAIFSLVLQTVDIFQFNTDMQTYTFGPMTITQKYADDSVGETVDGSITTDLQFLGSDGTSFQIDNVSLLPVLEINKDLDPINRSCRAYPEDDSLQCTYTEPSGTQFKGWKGYCLEYDPLDSGKCLVWWPLDILEGESSIAQRQPAGYTGRTSVYHCLASRGLSRPAFCDEDNYDDYSTSDLYQNDWGQGVLCSGSDDQVNNDAACGGVSGNGCFFGSNYVLDDTTSGGVNEKDTEDNNGDGFEDDNQTEKTQVTGGSCLITEDDDSNDLSYSCSQWPTTGTCVSNSGASTSSDDEAIGGANDQTSCENAGGTWTETVDIMNDVGVLDTGDCVNIDSDYNSTYDDETPLSADAYCFYDLDDTSGAEVRSTRSCDKDADCRVATSTAYDCASLSCQKGDFNESCTVGGTECNQVSGAKKVDNPYEVWPLRWQMHDPWEERDDRASDSNREVGTITRLPANEIFHNINVREMETIEFNPGSAGDGTGGSLEYPFWGQLNGTGKPNSQYDSSSESNLEEIGNIWLTDLKQGGIEFDDASHSSVKEKNIFTTGDPNCYPWRDGVFVGFGCRYWGLWDSDMVFDNYNALSLPDMSTDDSDDTGGDDLIYTFVWSNYDWDAKHNDVNCDLKADDAEPLTHYDTLATIFDDWFKTNCVDSSFKAVVGPDSNTKGPRNPFAHLESLAKEGKSDIWDKIYVPDITTQGPATVLFNQNDIGGDDAWAGWGDPEDTDIGDDNDVGSHNGGSNLLSLYLDVNNKGYIQAVYILTWVGADNTEDQPTFSVNAGVELTFDSMMHLAIQTRESCDLISESVDANGANNAWAQRFNPASSDGYEINYNTDTAYGAKEDYQPFGSITPQTGTPDSDTWDYLPTELVLDDGTSNVSGYGTFGKEPVVSYKRREDDNITAGHPLTCIGDCSVAACVADPTKRGVECSSSRNCGNGICMGIGDATISGEGLDAAYSSASTQLNGVVDDARNRLKFVLAAVKSGHYYKADFTTDQIYALDRIDYWDTDYSGTDDDIFLTMLQCDTDDGQRPTDQKGNDAEYCGVLPTVTGMSLNDQTGGSSATLKVTNGQTVTLKFTATVDGQQQPLNIIYIDWGDDTGATTDQWQAQPTTFTYTHAYNCDAGTARYKGDHCEFKPKVVVVDNWNWCSGLKAGMCGNNTYATEEACADHDSPDDSTDNWTNGGDHRYTADNGSNNIISNCQSYDEPGITINVDAAS